MITNSEAEALRSAIKATEYKYFGDYELSPDQWVAVDTLVAFAQRHLDASSPLHINRDAVA